MKNALYTIVLCMLQLSAWAQKPEQVKSFATELKPVSWYKQQSALWKKEIDRDKKNSNAWYNYYRANRCINRLDTTDTRNGQQKYEQEKKLVEEMHKAVPNSYEYNLCRWLIEGNKYEYVAYLEKAEQLGEGHTEHFADMIVWGEIARNRERKDKYAKKWYESGLASPGLLYYNYNVLTGLKPNAIVFTTGDNDTYPIWMLQSIGIRKDVTVLNLSLLYIDEYRNKIFNELGVDQWNMLPEITSINTRGLAEDVTGGEEKLSRYNREIVKHVARNSRSYPVYVGLTVDDNFTKAISDELYLTGLAYEYSNRPVDNMAQLRKNFEQQYALDYLDKPFFNDVSQHWVKQTNYNYIVPMIKLYDHYREAGENTKAEITKARVLSIVKGQPHEEETKNYFNKN